MKQYEHYEHHGDLVWVDTALKGRHREHCLCWQCDKFHPDEIKENCPIAQALFRLCVKYNLTTPVYECPVFEPKASA